MREKRHLLTILVLAISCLTLFGAVGRPKDGFLSFLVVLGFLGLILGIKLMIDYIRFLARRFLEFKRFLEKNGGDS